MPKPGICLFVLWISAFVLFANESESYVDSMQIQLDRYNREHPVNNLYVHIDRNEYAPGDTIWFKAYMLTPMINDEMYVLITDKNRNIVARRQVLVKDIRANGEIGIPEKLQEGEYRFVAFMDKMINFNSENVFVQPFRLSKNSKKSLNIEAFVSNVRPIKMGEKVEVVFRAKGEKVSEITGQFNLMVGDRVWKSGKISMNRQGESTIHFTYPKISDNEVMRVEAVLNSGDESANLMLNLRHTGNSLNVNVYPEGGHLLADVPNSLVFEVWDDSHSPVSTQLILMDGTKEVGKLITNKNGLGEISLIPQTSATYKMVVLDNGQQRVFEFPVAVEKSGCTFRMHLKQDSATVEVSTVKKSGLLRFIVRDFEYVVWSDTLSMNENQTRQLTLPTVRFPAGILSLIVSDEAGKTLSERVFMNKSTNEYTVVADVKRKQFKDVQSVGINMDITNTKGKPVYANLSVSVVEKSCLNLPEYKSILQTYYFHTLRNPMNRNFDVASPDLDWRLKASKWDTYGWDSIYQYKSKGALELLDNTAGMLYAVKRKNLNYSCNNVAVKTRSWNLKNPMLDGKPVLDTLVVTPSRHNRNTHLIPFIERIDSIPVVKNDYIYFSPNDLMAKYNEERLLYMQQAFLGSYELVYLDAVSPFEQNLLYARVLNFVRPFNAISTYVPLPEKFTRKSIQLKPIDIVSNGNELRLCDKIGDYYCMNKVINCPNHQEIEGRPIVGCVYSCEIGYNHNINIDYNGPDLPFTNTRTNLGVLSIHFMALKTINEPAVFFCPTIENASFIKNDERETVYWNPNLNTPKAGKVTFEFNVSNQRRTEYTIVVQGIDVQTFKPIFWTYNLKL